MYTLNFGNWKNDLSDFLFAHPKKCAAIGIGTTLIFSFLFWRKLKSKSSKKAPPQLLGLPFVGSLLTLLFYKEKYFQKLLPQYGDIVKYNLGSLTCYTISNAELLSKVLQKASMRPDIFTASFTRYNVEPTFMVCNDDRDWSFRRKTIMRHLNLLMNSTKVDEIISDTLKETLFKELELFVNDKTLWYPSKYTKNLSFNMIFLAMYGRTLNVNSKRFNTYIDIITYMIKHHPIIQMYDIFPSFMASFLFGKIEREFGNAYLRYMELVEQDINDTLKQVTDPCLTNQLWDIYKQHKHSDYGGKENELLAKNRLVADYIALTAAGMDTTGHAMEVGILLLAKYPKIQEIVYNELKLNVASGNNNSDNDNNDGETLISLSKLNECVKFRAFIGETLRIAASAPQGLPHTVDKDLRCVIFQNGKIVCDFIDSNTWYSINNNNNQNSIVYDYIIEANSFIDLNLGYVSQYNKESWNLHNDPMTLNLNYWLVKDEESGKLLFKNNSNSIPFSVGSRQCAGIALAMKEMRALMANLILNYKIVAQNNDADSIDLKFHTFASVTASVEPEIAVLVSKR